MNKLLLSFALIFSLAVTKTAQASYYEAPMAGTVAGFQIGGLKGAVLGFLVGCTDELLVSYDFTERHYLTAGSLAAGLVQPLKIPIQNGEQIKEGVAFLAGILLASGHLTSWLDQISQPLFAGLIGFNYGGPQYAAAGAVIGGIEQVLQNYNITSQPYASNVLFGLSAASVWTSQFGRLEQWKTPIGVLAGAALSYSSNANPAVAVRKSPTQLAQELYALFSQLMEPSELNRLIETQAIALVTSQLFTAQLMQRISSHDANMEDGISKIKDDHKQFFSALVGYSKFLVPYFAGSFVSKQASAYLTGNFVNHIENKLSDNYLSGEIPLKLSIDNTTQAAVKNLRENIQQSTLAGSELLSSALGSSVNAVFHVSFLIREKSTGLIVFVDSYQRGFGALNAYFSQWQANYEPLIKDLDVKISKLQSDANHKAHLIISSDKGSLLKEKMDSFVATKQELKKKQTFAQTLSSVWMGLSHTSDFILKYYYIGQQILKGQLPGTDRYKVLASGRAISTALSWSNENAVRISQNEYSTREVQNLLTAFKATPVSIGQLNFKAAQSDEAGIIMKNISFGVDEKPLGQIDDLALKSAVYAVTGPSGCGKSTFLKKLKGLTYSHGWASGDVTFLNPEGKSPKIALVSQEDYIMPYSNLMEVILSKVADSEVSHGQVEKLMTEIQLHKDNLLEAKDDWGLELSGGEKKKLAIVSAIIQAPDVLILDEVFNGMDSVSIKLAQDMLKKYLPQSLFLVVDHEYVSHNEFGFYEHELRFGQGPVKVVSN